MSQRIVAGGIGQDELLGAIRAELVEAHAAAVGIASAYVTVSGVERIRPVLADAGVGICRLVAGVDDEITHPEALRSAVDYGWEVRIGRANAGRFHPKLIVGGIAFDATGSVVDPRFCYVGSGNLTQPGLQVNAECALICRNEGMIGGAGAAFAAFWRGATPATADAIAAYAARFEERSRTRRPEVLEALGVTEGRSVSRATPANLRQEPLPRAVALSHRFAAAAWAGLESFTGEYQFQLEFPRAAGVVLELLVGAVGVDVNVLCVDDVVRSMHFDYYAANAMYRLNVPNEVPGVAWARGNHAGLMVAERAPAGVAAALYLRVLPPGLEADEVMARSYALGTWGRTPTRLFGWY